MHAALIKRRNQKMLSGINGRQLGVGLIVAMVILIIGLAIDYARAEPQTRLYDARGNSVGTAAPQGEGSTRYYDAHNRTCPRAPPDVAQGVPRGHPLERRRARDADRALGLP
jgi:hypothetical protein